VLVDHKIHNWIGGFDWQFTQQFAGAQKLTSGMLLSITSDLQVNQSKHSQITT